MKVDQIKLQLAKEKAEYIKWQLENLSNLEKYIFANTMTFDIEEHPLSGDIWDAVEDAQIDENADENGVIDLDIGFLFADKIPVRFYRNNKDKEYFDNYEILENENN